MLTEENVLDNEDPVLWKRRYKRIVTSVYRSVLQLSVEWHVRGVADAHFRLFETHNRHYQKMEGIVFCKASRLVDVLGDMDFERRARTGETLLGCNAQWSVEETFQSETLGALHVVRRAKDNDHMLCWHKYDAASQLWTFLYCPCCSRRASVAESPVRARWTCVNVWQLATDDLRYGKRCNVRILEYDGESRAPTSVFALNDAVMAYQEFCRDKERWGALYSEEARLARDVEKRA